LALKRAAAGAKKSSGLIPSLDLNPGHWAIGLWVSATDELLAAVAVCCEQINAGQQAERAMALMPTPRLEFHGSARLALAISRDTAVHERQIEPRQQIAPMCGPDQVSPSVGQGGSCPSAARQRDDSAGTRLCQDAAVKFVAWTRSFVLATPDATARSLPLRPPAPPSPM